MQISTLVAWAAAVAASQASYIGFNYGSTFTDGSAKQQSDFKDEFTRAKNLVGTKGEFTSARLYTMIQGGTADTPISAIPAAIDTQTTLLLGLWASAGQADFTNEVTALTSAIKQYGTAFTSLIAGISVGSEDLYRISPTGIENDSGAGANPADLVNYINQVRAAIRGTSASGAPIGHVDTWTAWVNGTNDAVIDAVDWLGMDACKILPVAQVCINYRLTLISFRPILREHHRQPHRPRQLDIFRGLRQHRGRRPGQSRLGHRDGLAGFRSYGEPGRCFHSKRRDVLAGGRLHPLRSDQHLVVRPARCSADDAEPIVRHHRF